MGKKIFITGISGFAGNYLARKLLELGETQVSGTYLSEQSKEVFADITSGLTLYPLDLMDQAAVLKIIEEVKPDEIYHLAAIASSAKSFDSPSEVIINNIASQLNLFEAVRKTGINPKIMIISSAEVYGKVDFKDLPIDEDTPLIPTNPYAVSKIAQDFMGLQYHLTYGLNIIRVRPFNHIGPGQTDQFATSAFAKKIAEIEKGKIEPILTVGSLDSKRDFTDVKDMVWAYILLMEKGKVGDVYNIGSGVSHKMGDVLNTLLSFSDAQIKIEPDQSLMRPSDNPELVCDNSKMKELTGWVPQVPINTTLKEILEYWRKKV